MIGGSCRRSAGRWLKFNAVGGIGIGVQLLAFTALTSGLHLAYLPATALAVETAVVHNFLWHERFTWADRISGGALPRFLRFNLTTGLVSIAGNILLMKLLAGILALQFVAANGIAIAICSIFNFAMSDRFVFLPPSGKTTDPSQSRNWRASCSVSERDAGELSGLGARDCL